MHRRRTIAAVTLCWILASPAVTPAADILQNLPPDALGFAIARNLGAADRKLERLLRSFQPGMIGPLAFLNATTGIGAGLDRNGGFLLAVLPGKDDRPEFCVWLPVSDYEQFLAALGGSPAEGITAVTIAGEDLLVARQATWALMMDPDQRGRMERLLAATPTPLNTAWQEWTAANDVTVVVLPDGVRSLIRWAASDDTPEAAARPAAEDAADDLFIPHGEHDETQIPPARDALPNDIVSTARTAIRELLSSSPKLVQWASEMNAIGCGLRLDDEGNALASLRADFSKDASPIRTGADGSVHDGLPPALYQGGDFIVSGAGTLPPPLTAAIANAYVHSLVRELKAEERLALDNRTLARFQQAVEQAAADITSIVVLTRPGDQQEGVYTNNFLAVRTTSADSFIDHANEVMRLWNQMNREAEQGTRLVFDVDDLQIGDRQATQYSIDIAAADGAPALPEIRQAMEKLFGPGGKLRLLIVPVDDHTALLAAATPEQTTAMLQTLDRKPAIDWSREQLDVTNRLLPNQADWRLFFSPHGYTSWLARQMDAITGPVFGGPLVKEFPSSPPIGAAGGFKDTELWAEIVVPAKTIESIPEYHQKRRGVQLQR